VAGLDQGVCGECCVPLTVCESWKWDRRHTRWVEDPGNCQYSNILIPVLMAMMELRSVKAVRGSEGFLRRNKLDPTSKQEVSEWFGREMVRGGRGRAGCRYFSTGERVVRVGV
jgi:hypothetical protein